MVHADVQAALDDNLKAQHYFAAFPEGVKRNLLRWIYEAKRPATRAQRIREVVTQAELNLRAR